MLVEMYKAGDVDAVWKIMSERARVDGAVLDDGDVHAVVAEACERILYNIDVITNGLFRCGYEFAHKHIRQPPGADSLETIERLEAKGGPIPLLLRGIYARVGYVNLSGGNMHWEIATHTTTCRDAEVKEIFLSDPVCFSTLESVEEELDATLEFPDIYPPAFMVSGDADHKAGMSGSSYSVASGTGVDGEMLGVGDPISLRQYLNDAFSVGGFFGLRGRLDDFPVLGRDLRAIANDCLIL